MSDNLTDFLPTESNHLKARYNPTVAIAMLVLGLLSFLVVLWAMLLTGKFNSGIITSPLLIGIGIGYLTRPYFSVAPNRLTLYSLLGSAAKRYTFVSFSDLTLKGNKLFIKDGDQRETKAKIAKWLTHPQDWEQLQNIANHQA